jgi:hypothetical protein
LKAGSDATSGERDQQTAPKLKIEIQENIPRPMPADLPPNRKPPAIEAFVSQDRGLEGVTRRQVRRSLKKRGNAFARKKMHLGGRAIRVDLLKQRRDLRRISKAAWPKNGNPFRFDERGRRRMHLESAQTAGRGAGSQATSAGPARCPDGG